MGLFPLRSISICGMMMKYYSLTHTLWTQKQYHIAWNPHRGFMYRNMLSSQYGRRSSMVNTSEYLYCSWLLTWGQDSYAVFQTFREEEWKVGEKRRKLLEKCEQLRGFDPLLLLLIRNICGDTSTMRVHHICRCQHCFQACWSFN